MYMQTKCGLILIAFIVGFIGDLALQVMTQTLRMGGKTGWGLLQYFKLHGRWESATIAGGMLCAFYMTFMMFNFKLTFLNMSIYGIIIDFAFRSLRIYPSLVGYYNNMSYLWSAVWGAIPMMLPLFVWKRVT